VFGGSALNMRAMDGRLHVLSIRTDVGLLDFDLDRMEVARRVEDYRLFARTVLDNELLSGPKLLDEACAEIETEVTAAIAEQSPGTAPTAVRAILAEPVGAVPRFLRLVHGPSIRGRSEDGLLLPVDGSLIGAAWRDDERAGIFDAQPFARAYDLVDPRNRHRRTLVRTEVTWRAAIPICESGGTSRERATMVLALDGEGDAAVAFSAIIEGDLMPRYGRRIADILDRFRAARRAADRHAEGSGT
jgi:NTE family protein